MARIKGAVTTRKRRKKILKLAKGFYGAKSKQFRTANQAVMRSLTNAYIGRKQKKRDFRALWITRISAACRMNDINYSQFMHGLKLAKINLNRKMLAEIAVSDPEAFTVLVNNVKKQLSK
jgi:large subunit ribosomal protein L20